MNIKDIILKMLEILEQLVKDLKKSEKGNKEASQRVRVNSIKFSKLSKEYRKESIEEEKMLSQHLKKSLKVSKKK